MNTTVGETEIRTQKRVVTFFQKTLGYSYLGNWHARQDNSNVEKDLLTDWLKSRRQDDAIIAKVLSAPYSPLIFQLFEKRTEQVNRDWENNRRIFLCANFH